MWAISQHGREGAQKKYQKVLNQLKCCHILKAYFLLVILIYNNHKFDQNMCSEQYRDCCTYFKVRVGCTRRSIRPFMKFYFYPVRQCGRIGKKGKKAKTDKIGKLWWIRQNRTSRTYRISKDKWQGSHKDGYNWAEGAFLLL